MYGFCRTITYRGACCFPCLNIINGSKVDRDRIILNAAGCRRSKIWLLIEAYGGCVADFNPGCLNECPERITHLVPQNQNIRWAWESEYQLFWRSKCNERFCRYQTWPSATGGEPQFKTAVPSGAHHLIAITPWCAHANLAAANYKSTVDPVGPRGHQPPVESHNSRLPFLLGHTT
ncbi:hypothetical protein T265_05190 [Opisthorchis viverrini]|uniref:Uncharacterized protein n=1 Tax=Opisthorchis viverrini TaxID=6198 RepID=A0A074ZWV9_OPIVI|nr:hypothetical protein T265_05190 [Opisthorchis viverrini]KER27830.1 hypothetical protein T265_05190 [Opisthorchis viverrini]